MSKPALLYLYPRSDVPPTDPFDLLWPELGPLEVRESDEAYSQNFCMGGPFESHHEVISIKADDPHALRYISECLKGVRVVAVRGQSSDPEWSAQLQHAADLGSFVVTTHDRHGVVSALGRKAFWDGIELLQLAAGYLQGKAVFPSDEAMRSEINIQRAVESLCKCGYRTPKG